MSKELNELVNCSSETRNNDICICHAESEDVCNDKWNDLLKRKPAKDGIEYQHT